MLAGGEHPHFTTINQLRLEHRAAFAELLQQVLELCMTAGDLRAKATATTAGHERNPSGWRAMPDGLLAASSGT